MRTSSTIGLGLAAMLALIVAVVPRDCRAEDDPALPVEKNPAEIDRLFIALDAVDGDTRAAAAQRLEDLAGQPAWQSVLAERARAALQSVETSYELRLRLKMILARMRADSLPANHVAIAQPIERTPNAAEIDLLIAQLDDNSPAVRASAAERLTVLAWLPSANGIVLARLTKIVDEPCDAPGLARQRQRLWNVAHSAWLTSDPATWRLPDVTDAQISAWVSTLAKAGAPQSVAAAAAQASARRQLVDLMARDECVARVRQALAIRLSDPQLDVDAADRLKEIDDWARPALVAEYWQGPEHLGIQHLLIGVPNLSEGAERPSLFDRSDHATAHCVSGNSLSPGDYPVGVFFPHPRDSGAQFHLVDLPTPRHRLAYNCDVERPAAIRWAEITERTLGWMIARGQPLSLGELSMLEGLDAEAVSRFAGRYLRKVDDSLYDDGMQSRLVGQLSRHQNLCCLLARVGTPAAVPGIVAAIEAGRFLPPKAEAPYHWAWLAALAIANREPWPESDEWLAGLVARTDPLVYRPAASESAADANDREAAPAADVETPAARGDVREVRAPGALWRDAYAERTPDVGACAAGMLLVRHRLPPSAFGLDSTAFPPFTSFGISGYWFRDAAGRDKVLSWWQEQRRAADLRSPALPSVALDR
ncbi:MAG: hypothetical protein K2Y37_24820 [Pirellulales bacterium]|nr:hypothetical protein [Pirellulales bacterium]